MVSGYAQVTTAVVSGVIVFVLGQMFQQYILEPVREFRRQRADAIYFALHFIEFVNGETSWDVDDKRDVAQMKAALIQSLEMIPHFGLLSLRLFGLPRSDDVYAAAKKIAHLAKRVNGPVRKGEPSDLKLAREICALLGVKVKTD